jgi:hypothetical protein
MYQEDLLPHAMALKPPMRFEATYEYLRLPVDRERKGHGGADGTASRLGARPLSDLARLLLRLSYVLGSESTWAYSMSGGNEVAPAVWS